MFPFGKLSSSSKVVFSISWSSKCSSVNFVLSEIRIFVKNENVDLQQYVVEKQDISQRACSQRRGYSITFFYKFQ